MIHQGSHNKSVIEAVFKLCLRDLVGSDDNCLGTEKHNKRLGTEMKGGGLKSSNYTLVGNTKASLLELSLIVP